SVDHRGMNSHGSCVKFFVWIIVPAEFILPTLRKWIASFVYNPQFNQFFKAIFPDSVPADFIGVLVFFYILWQSMKWPMRCCMGYIKEKWFFLLRKLPDVNGGRIVYGICVIVVVR